jgi:methyl-accepting chemotaxis protein
MHWCRNRVAHGALDDLALPVPDVRAGLAVVGAAILIYTGYIFVLEPVGQLKRAIEKIQEGNFDARVEHDSSDEFGTLARGFNGMADNLQSMYRNLEHKVAEKTANSKRSASGWKACTKSPAWSPTRRCWRISRRVSRAAWRASRGPTA